MKNIQKVKQLKKERRVVRVRARIFGTAARPRLRVFRSAKHMYAQLIDDTKGRTLAAASDSKREKTSQAKEGMTTKVGIAYAVGEALAKIALGKGIKEAVFDRGGYRYHGRIKAVADGAREGGLKF